MTKSINSEASLQVAVVRAFNRYYTQTLGALSDRYLKSSYGIAETHIICELAGRPGITATELGRTLGLDRGYLSRLLTKLQQRRIITRTPSVGDARLLQLKLSKYGQSVFEKLNGGANRQVAHLLDGLTPSRRARLLAAIGEVTDALKSKGKTSPLVFRALRLGDMGWIIHRHGAGIAKEFGWDERFEATVARISSDFITQFVPGKERSFVAERDGEILGSIYLVRGDEETAKLRLLYVEPVARGMGLGRKLVEKSVRFAREVGYRRVSLFTTAENVGARRIYETLGFTLASEEPFNEFGPPLVGQTWELMLE